MTGSGWRRGALVALVAVAGAATGCLPAVVGPAASGRGGTADSREAEVAPQDCGQPAEPLGVPGVDPAAVGMDAPGVAEAVRYVSDRGAQSARVYRHGCLVATSWNDKGAENTRLAGWSMTKGVVSMVVGRAVATGALGVDDPIGAHLDGLDQAHGAITVRQLLTQTSGLRMAWASDIWDAANADSAALVLHRPFQAAPGTQFNYAQTTLTALVAVVEAAIGEDFQDFARRELFEPLGITADMWLWGRDPVGRTQGFAFLDMTPPAWARLGQLLLDEGEWRGRQLLPRWYVREGAEGTQANPAYGFLWWTNRGDWHLNAGFPAYVRKARSLVPTLPRDAFALQGLFDQDVTIIPSLDMVIVRLGPPSELFYDPLGEVPGQKPEWRWRFNRALMAAVTDVEVADPGPWRWEGRDPDIELSNIFELSLPPFVPPPQVSGWAPHAAAGG